LILGKVNLPNDMQPNAVDSLRAIPAHQFCTSPQQWDSADESGSPMED